MNAKNLCLVVALALVVFMTFWLIRGSARDPGSRSLLVGTNVWTGYEPLYLARSLDYFDETKVRLVECSSASQVISAFRNGSLDVAALTLDEALLLKERGYEVKVILVTDISHGGDAILAQPAIAELSELKGRKVGVESSALGAYVLTRALQSINMAVSDVDVVSLEPKEQERAFNNQRIDAVVTFEPVRSRLLESGARLLFDSTQIPGEIVDVLVVRESVLLANREVVETLLDSWFRATRYLQEHPQEAAPRMADRLELAPAKVLDSFAGLRLPGLNECIEMLDGENATLNEVAGRLVEVMREAELLRSDVDWKDLFSAEVLKQLRHERVP